MDALPAIKTVAAELQNYAVRINEGKHNEEVTNVVVWGNEADYIWFGLDTAIPTPLPQVLQDKLPAIRTQIRKLKTYAVNTGMAAFRGTVHICHHGEVPPTCEPEQDI